MDDFLLFSCLHVIRGNDMGVEISELMGFLDTALAMVQNRMARAPGWQVLHLIQAQLHTMQDDIRQGRTPTAETILRSCARCNYLPSSP